MVHSSFLRDAQHGVSTMANSCPHVDFDWVLRPGFVLGLLPSLVITRPLVCFHLHGGFVRVCPSLIIW